MAAAAYRAGDRLRDERTGVLHDYTHRREFIESWIQSPEQAPAWTSERGELWNGVERGERRRDAQLAREVEVALPVELDRDRQRELLRGFVRDELVARGMVADVCVHRHDPGNPHAHIMLSTRTIGPEGFGNKNRDWNAVGLHGRLREEWARHQNRALGAAGRDERVDHRSNGARGIDREPTRHDGPNVRAMEKRGVRTDRGEQNREARRRNRDRDRGQDLQKGRFAGRRTSLQSPPEPERGGRQDGRREERRGGRSL